MTNKLAPYQPKCTLEKLQENLNSLECLIDENVSGFLLRRG